MTLQEFIEKAKAKQAEKQQPNPEAVKAFMEKIKAAKAQPTQSAQKQPDPEAIKAFLEKINALRKQNENK
jgi:methyltransferase-like protein